MFKKNFTNLLTTTNYARDFIGSGGSKKEEGKLCCQKTGFGVISPITKCTGPNFETPYIQNG